MCVPCWKRAANSAINQVTSSLKPHDRKGLGPMYYNQWEKAKTWVRCTMIQEEVKEDSRRSKAVGLGMQGSWTMWELLSRKVTWAELWRLDAFHFIFLLLSVCDTLSSAHFHTWGLAVNSAAATGR